jgi:hypothetical protein
MRCVPRHVAALGTLLVALGADGCSAHRKPQDPSAVLTEFRAALSAGDSRRAYQLLSADLRRSLSQADFDAQWKHNPQELAGLERALGSLGAPEVSARVALLGTDQVVRLERDAEGAFRIASPLTRFYSQATPRDALRSFVLAVENARWDAVLSLMPERDRSGLDAATLGKHLSARREELTRLVALLKTAQEAPIEIVGDRATMPYGESFTARFLLESDGWKIEDPG